VFFVLLTFRLLRRFSEGSPSFVRKADTDDVGLLGRALAVVHLLVSRPCHGVRGYFNGDGRASARAARPDGRYVYI
jgi:hypothetical protein